MEGPWRILRALRNLDIGVSGIAWGLGPCARFEGPINELEGQVEDLTYVLKEHQGL